MNERTASLTPDPAAFDATRVDRGFRCYLCEKMIVDGDWFARIKMGDARVAFCSPRCLEKFLGSPEKYDRHLGQPIFA